nr:uncharacterized protein LOC112717505 [Arachis hypogaea]
MDTLLAQNKAIATQLAALTKKVEASQVSVVQAQAPPQEEDASEVECEWEQANYVNNPSRPVYDSNSKTYNPGWKNHPNFRRENQQDHKPYHSNHHNNHNTNHQSRNNRPYHSSQNTSHHPTQQTHNSHHQDTSTPTMQLCETSNSFSKLEAAIAQLSTQLTRTISTILERQLQADRKIDANQEEAGSNIKNQGAAISKLKAQLGSLSKQISMSIHTFSSDTVANPRGECKAIKLRSGKVVEETTPSQSHQEEEIAKEHKIKKEENTSAPSSPKQVLKPYVPQAPYTQRLRKDEKDSQFSRFLEIFKKLQIIIPFAEALEQTPFYAKFLKELMKRKRNWGEKETVVLTEECSVIIQKKLPQKLKDPGSFQIPCIIGNMNIEKALYDLEASINLMSLAMMKIMRIEEAKPTRMALQLADRTFKFSHGELVLRLHEAKMVFNVIKEMSYPKEAISECMMVDTIENMVQRVIEEEQYEETQEQDQQVSCGELPLEAMDKSIMMDKPSKRKLKAPKLELKILPPSWTLADLEGISPSMCMHKILLDEGAKPSRQQQRRLNPTMNELMMIQESHSFADIANFKAIAELPTNINKYMKRKLLNDAKHYIWDELYLFKKGVDGILRRCISQEEG